MTPTPLLPAPRALLEHLPAYVAGRRATSADVAALASNESHHAPLPSVLTAIAEASQRVNRYPDPQGLALRDAIAAHVGVDVEQVAIGPGSNGILQQLLAAICDPGDEVVHAWRSFEAYPILARLAGATPVGVPLDGERHDLPAMAAAITPRTRVVLLCTPNNPTGVALTTAEVEHFLAAVPRDVLVVIDEAYVEYDGSGFDGPALLRRHPNVALVRTFSKAHGLAGLRLGYAVAAPAIAEAIRRTMLTFAVTDLAQAAGLASLAATAELRERVGQVVAERTRVTAELRRLGWETPDSQANFVWLRCGDHHREELLAAFDAADVLVRGYAGDGIRITLADRASNDRALAILTAAPAVVAVPA
ncbi:MAG: histidinol-phosphate transaminase [Nocardioides sp.]|uniref:histidinol-phosphate transaminase n=1 Tax=Nocardioides sp. TaxID=35761 RepID=UPI0039E5B44F